MVVWGLQGWPGLGGGEENVAASKEVRREGNRRSAGSFSKEGQCKGKGEDPVRNGVGRASGGRWRRGSMALAEGDRERWPRT